MKLFLTLVVHVVSSFVVGTNSVVLGSDSANSVRLN